MKNQKISTAVILVGGKGTRLRGLFDGLPKPLIPVSGNPFLNHVLTQLHSKGLQRIILLTGHLGEQFSYFPLKNTEFHMSIELCHENAPLGTAGALRNALPLLENESEFLVVNGDTFFEGDWGDFLSPLNDNEDARIGVCWMNDASRYGLVNKNKQNRILAFSEKQTGSSGWVNAGFSILSKKILREIPNNQFLALETDIFPKLQTLYAHEFNGSFFDIGIPESYAEFNSDMVLREAFSQSVFLGHLLVTWLQNGTVFTDSLSQFNRLPSKINSILLDSNNINLLMNFTTKKDLLLSQKKTISEAINLDVSEETFSFAINSFSIFLKNIEPSRGLFNTEGISYRPALFLDRDGVVIEFANYLSHPADVRLHNDIISLIRKAHEKKWAVVIITNQSGLGREYFNWSDYDLITQRMLELLAKEGEWIDSIQHSAYYEKSCRTYGLLHAGLRKPNPGMIISASKSLRIQINRSILIGDSASDIEAGALSGITKNYFFESSTRANSEKNKLQKEWPCRIVHNLNEIPIE